MLLHRMAALSCRTPEPAPSGEVADHPGGLCAQRLVTAAISWAMDETSAGNRLFATDARERGLPAVGQ
jgi:hypothetical protein